MTFHSMFPKRGQWQIELIPNFSILRINYTRDMEEWMTKEEILQDKERKYYSITIGWLFWSINKIIYI